MSTTKTKPKRAPRNVAAAHPFRAADGLALHPEHAREALLLAEPEKPAAWSGDGAPDPLEDVDITDGVAVVSVRGFLMPKSWWCENYQDIVARTKAALASPSVRAVVLSIDSPGGMVAGLFDAMRSLRAAKASSGKRMVAHTATNAYSAAYGLASTCDEIATSDTAGVGSVGVIDALMSRVGELEQAGIDVRVIASGVEKTDGHPAVAITPAAEKRKRDRVMQLAGMFSAEVTAGRAALTAEAITELAGGVRYGRDAVGAGLADRIASLEEVVAGLAAKTPNTSPYPASQRAATPTRNTMSEKLLNTIAALTGETDPDRQLGAVQATFDEAKKAQTLATELATLKAEQKAAAEKAEKASKAAAFDAALAKGQADGKLTPAEAEQWRADFAKGECSLGVLEGNLARRAPIAALTQEHKDIRPPATPLPVGSPSALRAAELANRGFAALTWGERAEFQALAPDQYTSAHAAWVAAGSPGNR